MPPLVSSAAGRQARGLGVDVGVGVEGIVSKWQANRATGKVKLSQRERDEIQEETTMRIAYTVWKLRLRLALAAKGWGAKMRKAGERSLPQSCTLLGSTRYTWDFRYEERKILWEQGSPAMTEAWGFL